MGARELKRGPISVARLAAVSELGHVLDLTIDEGRDARKYRFKRPMPLLLWSPKYDALLWWESAAKLPKRRKLDNDELPARAAKVWEKFHGWEADTERTVKRSEPKNWTRVGRAVSIGYRDPDKWGKDDAEHDFGHGVNVYRAGSLWVVKGGKLRLTEHGIEG